MRTTTACIAAILAAAMLASCSSGNDSNEAATKVQGVCEDLGVKPGGRDDWNDGSSTDWAGMARLQNDVANRAAAAAVSDPLWNRLADTLSDLAAIAQRYADASPAPSALSPEDSDAVRQSGLVVHAECRKAYAAG
ncbi:hypothetical protein OH768_44130 [Streptomyces sp. NBC_01622]|uniref:hypothetical protein n=1 Tax=Streptomyces sp. NBC_01622 TaxID=2975903 RepID=UPI003868E722|nr:hypothetical protein OH768_44130 [Streptomyces sp. NBC_01622]